MIRPGVLSARPMRLQCEACGLTDDAESRGWPEGGVLVLSTIHHHGRASWTTGHTDNPRLCRTCRLARGCQCDGCKWERQGRAR